MFGGLPITVLKHDTTTVRPVSALGNILKHYSIIATTSTHKLKTASAVTMHPVIK
jgi:hypothetical protein